MAVAEKKMSKDVCDTCLTWANYHIPPHIQAYSICIIYMLKQTHRLLFLSTNCIEWETDDGGRAATLSRVSLNSVATVSFEW